ncbi:MAG TPA: lysylphosphatidylglycerol synthase transmembrane domain-containing protein [Pirellulaceae bacterium]|nr:lysylphosphatidylglycerol synthase transmembrane domain-containing protein [Pirellulaceae bacterium]
MKLKPLVSNALKVAVSAAMIALLVYQVRQDTQFYELAAKPKDWAILVWALPLCLAAVTLTILRWHLLVRTLGLQFQVREALRAGFLAYAFNLLPVGLVAGDSLKAVMLIHRQPRRKTEAVTTVLIDRVIGLYALLLLAAAASLFLPPEQLERLEPMHRTTILTLCGTVRALAVGSTLGLIVMLIPAVTRSRLWDGLEHTPLIGGILHKLVGAMRTYRSRPDRLLIAVALSIGIHLLYVTAVAFIAQGIGIAPSERPPVRSIFVIVPPSMIAGALPIGVYEITITLLFRAISPPGAPPNTGLLVALCYRVIQILIGSIGVVYWLTSRGEVKELIHEAEEQPPEELLDEPATATPA